MLVQVLEIDVPLKRQDSFTSDGNVFERRLKVDSFQVRTVAASGVFHPNPVSLAVAIWRSAVWAPVDPLHFISTRVSPHHRDTAEHEQLLLRLNADHS